MKTKLAFWLAMLCAGGVAPAATVTFEGTIGRDDALVKIRFRASTGEVRIVTTSYAAGGFDPALSVFDSAGLLIGFSQDFPGAAADPSTGFAFDAEIVFPSLPKGKYLAVLSQSQNTPFGPFYGDGFVYTGQPTFTGDISGFPGEKCRDLAGNARTCTWSVNFEGVESASQVPEPLSAFLIPAALAAGLFRLRRHARDKARADARQTAR